MTYEPSNSDIDAQLDPNELTALLRSLSGPTPHSEQYRIADPDRPVVYVFERAPGCPIEHVATEPTAKRDDPRTGSGAR